MGIPNLIHGLWHGLRGTYLIIDGKWCTQPRPIDLLKHQLRDNSQLYFVQVFWWSNYREAWSTNPKPLHIHVDL